MAKILRQAKTDRKDSSPKSGELSPRGTEAAPSPEAGGASPQRPGSCAAFGASLQPALKRRAGRSSNFDRWMTDMRKSFDHQRETEDHLATTRQQALCKVEKVPMLQNSSKKAAGKIVRDCVELMKVFHSFDTNQSGTIEPQEFVPMIAQLMRQPVSELDRDQVWRMWDLMDADGSGTICFEEFLKWYCSTFDVEIVNDFTDFFTDELVPHDQRPVREVATKLGIDFVSIEKIWKHFQVIDTDSSGFIDADEFKALLRQQLAPDKESPEVPAKVMDKFWMDVDVDRSGHITFEEFAAWYLKYFCGNMSPMEQYYHVLGKGMRRTTLTVTTEP